MSTSPFITQHPTVGNVRTAELAETMPTMPGLVFEPLRDGEDLTRGRTDSVGNSIRHVESAPSRVDTVLARTNDMLEFDLAAALDRPREAISAALAGAFKKSDASVRNGTRLLGKGVIKGASAVTSVALKVEQTISARSDAVASRLKDASLMQLLRVALPGVRRSLARQIFVMFHRELGIPLGQKPHPGSPLPPYELRIYHLDDVVRPADLDTIITSLSIQARAMPAALPRRLRVDVATSPRAPDRPHLASTGPSPDGTGACPRARPAAERARPRQWCRRELEH